MSDGDLSRRLAALSPSQREALLRKLGERRQGASKAAAATALPELVPRPEARFEPFALTDVQQAFWAGRSGLFDHSTLGANGYFELHFERFAAADLPRLARAWARTVERHDMLRVVVGADGVQRVLPTAPLYEPPVVDLRGRSAEEVEAALEATRRRLQEAKAPVDRWPLFDLVAHLLDGDQMRLALRFELIGLDGETRLLAFRDLFDLFNRPQAAVPPPSEVAYRDYAETWRGFRGSELYRRAEDYWRRRAAEMPPAAELPMARGLDPRSRSRFEAWSRRVLEADDWTRLRQRGAAHGATPSQVLTAAALDVFARWSGRRDFSIALEGTFNPPIHPGLDEVVGNFNAFLLLSVDDPAPTFADRLRALRRQLAASLEHQWYSGFRVLRLLNRRDGESTRVAQPFVFNSLLEFAERDASRAANAVDTGVRHVEAGMYPPQLQLIQTVAEYGGNLFCRLKGVPASFAPGLLPTLADAYGELLVRLARDDAAWEAPWAEEAAWLLPEAQREVRPAAPEPPAAGSEADVWALVCRHAENDPERPALHDAAGTLTYGELVSRAAEAAEGPAAGRHWLASALAAQAAGTGPLTPAAAAALAAAASRWGLGAGDRVSWHAAPGSVLTYVQALAPLTAGAAVALPGAAEQANVWIGSPLAAEALADDAAAPPLRLVVLSHGRVPAALPERLRRRFGAGLAFGRLAGAAEAAPAVAAGLVDAAWEAALEEAVEALPPALPGVLLRVTGEAGEECPDWVVGRLEVSGPAVTDGRWRGDLLARHLPGGAVDLLGDAAWARPQALGHAVEARWVEAVLERLPGVRRAVVAERPAEADDGPRRRLAAWLLTDGGSTGDEAAWAERLGDELPAYAVPSPIVRLDALPADADGALDRAALAALGAAAAEPPPAPPELVAWMADAWRRALGDALPEGELPFEVRFYELGGDSLGLARLAAAVERRYGAVRLDRLLVEPTVLGMARAVASATPVPHSEPERSKTTQSAV